MTKSIAVFGGSFNPPGEHHRAIVREVAAVVDEVVVVPCGPRPDKPPTNDVATVFRAAMVDMNFRGLAKVTVDLSDLENCVFTRTCELDERFRRDADVWHVVGADLVAGGGRGGSEIQRLWHDGTRLWSEAQFIVVHRPGYDLNAADLPPHHRVIEIAYDGASSGIRSQLFHHQATEGLLLPEVAAYIERHGLYRGAPPVRQARWTLADPKFLVVADDRNPVALELADRLGPSNETNPNLIVVIGGDGTMLRAIRQHWRRRVPFFGVNTGHLGFLLNEQSPHELLNQSLILEHLPLLYAEAVGQDGRTHQALAFNDAWVERATGQTAWLQVRVDGRERMPELVADGALVSTAAGSTSYARAMGAIAVPLNTPVLLLVGSNVLRPSSWKPVVMPLDAQVELRTLDPQKRPLHGYIDGVSQGLVHTLRARVSNIASVELAFAPTYHPEAKLAQIQFPAPDQWSVNPIH